MTLTANGKKVKADGSEEEATLKAIPYCTWNNRGADQMAVWIPSSKVYATAVRTPPPEAAPPSG